MKYFYIYIIIYLVFSQKVFSQNNDEIIQSFDKALSYHYTNKDSAYYYYEKTIKLADKNNNIEYLLNSYLYLINANGLYYDLENYEINIQREETILKNDKRLDTFKALTFYTDYILFDKGNYNYKIKQYSNSKKYFKTLFNKINTIPLKNKTKEDFAMLSSLHSFLALIYKHTNKYELATNYCENGIVLIQKYKDSIYGWESRINNLRKTLSQVYFDKKDFHKANNTLDKVLTFYKSRSKNPRNKNSLLSTFILAAKNNIKQKKYNKTIHLLNESKQYYKNDNPFAKESDLLFGDANLGLKNYTESALFYNKSLQSTIAYHNNKKHPDLSIIYAKLGKLNFKQKKNDSALIYYQIALTQLEKGFNEISLNTNPNPKRVSSKTILISILKDKLDALFNSYLKTNKLRYLDQAYNTSKTIIKTLDELRPEFESKVDKEFLIQQTYPSIQKMVAITYLLYIKTKNEAYINEAFFFMEKSKSILLLEAQRNAEATKYGEVPKNILTKEQQFRAKITHLEQEIFKHKSDSQSLNDTLFSVKNNYRNLLFKVEQQYPEYYKLKYKSDVVSIQTISQNLEKNQALLSYMITKKNIYLVVIDIDKKSFYKLPFDTDLKNTIKNLYKKSSVLNIEDVSIYNDSYTVYKKILEPALKNIKATDLVIIADDILNYIPFDALVTSEKKQNFVLEYYSISYASSATLLQENNKIKPSNNNKLLAFAPKFGVDSKPINYERNDLSPLLYNTKEAQQIARFFNGKIFTGDKASIKNFNAEINNYNLLHFATHASANDEFPDYSYLAFSNKNKQSNLLYVKDLYNYTINTDLVTLSACQTGIGKLQKGEGMLSLARAFNYAGATAIVTTLWKIDDQSTSEIMVEFYKNLKKGLSKKDALRHAKLKYLKSNKDQILRHPYYWSGIILTGNTMPITNPNYNYFLFLSVILLIVIMAVIFLKRT